MASSPGSVDEWGNSSLMNTGINSTPGWWEFDQAGRTPGSGEPAQGGPMPSSWVRENAIHNRGQACPRTGSIAETTTSMNQNGLNWRSRSGRNAEMTTSANQNDLNWQSRSEGNAGMTTPANQNYLNWQSRSGRNVETASSVTNNKNTTATLDQFGQRNHNWNANRQTGNHTENHRQAPRYSNHQTRDNQAVDYKQLKYQTLLDKPHRSPNAGRADEERDYHAICANDEKIARAFLIMQEKTIDMQPYEPQPAARARPALSHSQNSNWRANITSAAAAPKNLRLNLNTRAIASTDSWSNVETMPLASSSINSTASNNASAFTNAQAWAANDYAPTATNHNSDDSDDGAAPLASMAPSITDEVSTISTPMNEINGDDREDDWWNATAPALPPLPAVSESYIDDWKVTTSPLLPAVPESSIDDWNVTASRPYSGGLRATAPIFVPAYVTTAVTAVFPAIFPNLVPDVVPGFVVSNNVNDDHTKDCKDRAFPSRTDEWSTTVLPLPENDEWTSVTVNLPSRPHANAENTTEGSDATVPSATPTRMLTRWGDNIAQARGPQYV